MSNTINQQTSVGNAGVGSVGNQTNEQIQAGIKVQIPNDADRVASLENRIGDLEKERKGLLAACACSVSICVAFFLGFLFIKSNFPSDISLFVASLVVGFIGALATLVVVKNESQVREAKNEFSRNVEGAKNEFSRNMEETKNEFGRNVEGAKNEFSRNVERTKNEFSRNLSEIEDRMEKRLDNSLDSVHHIMEAIGYQAFAVSYFNNIPSLALEFLMCAINHTNKATRTWEVVDGIIHSILMLKEERAVEVLISPHKKQEYREILMRCKHEKKDEVMEFIESRAEPYIPKPDSPWADQSHTADSSPEK